MLTFDATAMYCVDATERAVEMALSLGMLPRVLSVPPWLATKIDAVLWPSKVCPVVVIVDKGLSPDRCDLRDATGEVIVNMTNVGT